ncbi:Spo0E family sporulation regulatory protein-aspartic acid phosphatase [uncultured Clostridium sp.]|uniref:Spo0E family sporulation regulatory protein-aspartic acid phosphatase n=1 Tax=uncultured Clostridium sp. TaxID=59620 RepID=UPI00262CBBCF|nr:Spo0E family sporulation regulatory protein-aspartic acid phosphatase [uncultured Clostridium sp.]
MSRKEIQKKIKSRKKVLNMLLTFMKRTNPIVVLMSQNLDKFILKEQYIIYKAQIRKDQSKISKVA